MIEALQTIVIIEYGHQSCHLPNSPSSSARIHPEITCSAFPYRRRKIKQGVHRPKTKATPPDFADARPAEGPAAAQPSGTAFQSAIPITQNGLLANSTSSSGSTAHPLLPRARSPSKRLAAVPAYVAPQPGPGPVAQASTWPQWPPNPIPQPTPLSSGPQNTVPPAAYNTAPPSKTAYYSLFTPLQTQRPSQQMPLPQEPPQAAHRTFEHRF